MVSNVLTCEEWKIRLNEINYVTDIISRVDDLGESLLWTVGEVPNYRLMSYLEAFKMINEQILKKAV